MHRHHPVTVIRSVSAAAIFAGCAGAFAQASQLAATAAPPSALPLSVRIINMGGVIPDEISPVIAEVGTLRIKTLVMAANGMVGVQVGTVARHTYAYSDEIQYVMSGTTTVWFGNAPREVRVGDLIVIPHGAVHGTLTTSTDFKSMVIELPPQRAGDTHKVP